jgi:hypothetical protein
MAIFRVKLTQQVIEEAVVEVEADDRYDAEQRALILADNEKLRWRYFAEDPNAEPEVFSARKIKA